MRLIDADKIKLPDDLPYKASVKRVLAMAPTVDAVPVQHGKWVDDPDIWRCDQCLEWLDIMQGTADMSYCPHCGAKMDWGAYCETLD